jgi:hypothetical protein
VNVSDISRKDPRAILAAVEDDGLKALLRLHPERTWNEADVDAGISDIHCLTGEYDPAGLSGIRDRWHRRLDVPIEALPYWTLLAAMAAAPLLWATSAVRRWRTQRRLLTANLCGACGYDLRATPDRCPECGAVPRAAKGVGA